MSPVGLCVSHVFHINTLSIVFELVQNAVSRLCRIIRGMARGNEPSRPEDCSTNLQAKGAGTSPVPATLTSSKTTHLSCKRVGVSTNLMTTSGGSSSTSWLLDRRACFLFESLVGHLYITHINFLIIFELVPVNPKTFRFEADALEPLFSKHAKWRSLASRRTPCSAMLPPSAACSRSPRSELELLAPPHPPGLRLSLLNLAGRPSAKAAEPEVSLWPSSPARRSFSKTRRLSFRWVFVHRNRCPAGGGRCCAC